MTNAANRVGIITILCQVFWPPASPAAVHDGDSRAWRTWWIWLCILTVIPLTAILHHAVFHRPTCMIHRFGPDYTPSVVWMWLSRDPSLAWAVIAASILYRAGNRNARVRLFAAPLFFAFLPLSLWVWDIPFTGRWICDHFHDGRGRFMVHGLRLRGRYIHTFGFVFYLLCLWDLLLKQRMGNRPRTNEGAVT